MESPESHSSKYAGAASPHRHKRFRGTPTGHTPRRPPKRTPLRVRDQQQQVERRRLSYEAEPKSGPSPWTEEEIKALVEFILFYEKDNKWPSHKRSSTGKGQADSSKSDADVRNVLVNNTCLCVCVGGGHNLNIPHSSSRISLSL